MAAETAPGLSTLVRWLDANQEAAGAMPDASILLPYVLEQKNTERLILHYQNRLECLYTVPQTPSKGRIRALLPHLSPKTKRKFSLLLSRWSGGNYRHLRNYAEQIITREKTNTRRALNNLQIARAIYDGDVEEASNQISRAVGLVQWAARRELRNELLPLILTHKTYTTANTPLHKRLAHPITGAYKKFLNNTWLSFSTIITPTTLVVQPRILWKKTKAAPPPLGYEELQFKKTLSELGRAYEKFFNSPPTSIQKILPLPEEVELALINNDQKLILATTNYLKFPPINIKLAAGWRKPPYELIHQLSRALETRSRVSWEGAQRVAESIKNK